MFRAGGWDPLRPGPEWDEPERGLPYGGDPGWQGYERTFGQAYGEPGYGTYERELRERYFRQAGEGLRPRGGFAGVGPVGYRRPDQRIYEDVCDALTDHHELDASDIEVTVVNGEVTLRGTVSSRGGKRLAEDLSAQVRGVREVHNQLRLPPEPARVPTAPSPRPNGHPGNELPH
ncbi:MAG: BON domain-containing protein [Myxococcota bacterium]